MRRRWRCGRTCCGRWMRCRPRSASPPSCKGCGPPSKHGSHPTQQPVSVLRVNRTCLPPEERLLPPSCRGFAAQHHNQVHATFPHVNCNLLANTARPISIPAAIAQSTWHGSS